MLGQALREAVIGAAMIVGIVLGLPAVLIGVMTALRRVRRVWPLWSAAATERRNAGFGRCGQRPLRRAGGR